MLAKPLENTASTFLKGIFESRGTHIFLPRLAYSDVWTLSTRVCAWLGHRYRPYLFSSVRIPLVLKAGSIQVNRPMNQLIVILTHVYQFRMERRR